MKKDKMVGWHHRLDGHEFEQAPGVWEVLDWGHYFEKTFFLLMYVVLDGEREELLVW